jgi:hypothetical protein
LVQHGNYIDAFFGLRSEDATGTEEADFFCGIPVELNGMFSLVVGDGIVQENCLEGFQDGHAAGSVVI